MLLGYETNDFTAAMTDEALQTITSHVPSHDLSSVCLIAFIALIV